MRRLFFLISVIFALAVPAFAQDTGQVIYVINTEGPLTPALAEYLRRGIRTAEQDGAAALIMQLNTPGGSLDLMNEMVRDIRASEVPVIVYVAPRGAIAGSAGTVLTMAGHIAAMAPETAIGAASPVGGQGEDLGETIETKLKEATKATVRALMEGRPQEAVALAEATIDDAKAATATEALSAGMIDLIASDIPDLLRQVDGRTVELASGSRLLETAYVNITELPPSFVEQLFGALTNPNIVFILLSLGVQTILIELGNPGGWVAGFIGAVCLTLAGFGLGLLDVNWVGLIFLIISFVLFVLDIKAAAHGALTTAGVVTFIIGALVLFNSPGTPDFQRVSVPLVIVMGVAVGGSFALILMFALRARNAPIQHGRLAILGRVGIARSDLSPYGQVQLGGERWSAEPVEGAGPITRGTRVEVVEAKGLRLYVRPVQPQSDPGEAKQDADD